MQRFFIIMILLLTAISAEAQNVKVVTEDFPPYNYEEKGEITGLSTKVVRAVFKEIGTDCNINLYTWAKAYNMALEEENILIYSILRISEREKSFKWVGEIAVSEMYFFKLRQRDDIKIASLDDAKKYVIGVTRETAPHQYLSGKGFELKEIDSRDELSIRKLVNRRIDLMPYYDIPFIYKIKGLGYTSETFEKAYFLKEASEKLYMAFSIKTSDQTVEKFVKALEKIKADGTYEKIIKEYQ